MHEMTQARLGTNPESDSLARNFIRLYGPCRGMSVKEPTVAETISTPSARPTFLQRRAVHPSSFFPHTRQLPQLLPLFPVGNYTPDSPCAHFEPIPYGSAFCCMVCHISGLDDHPALETSCPSELKSELKRGTTLRSNRSSQKIPLETRKQRRQRLFSGTLKFPSVYFCGAKLHCTDSVSARKT